MLFCSQVFTTTIEIKKEHGTSVLLIRHWNNRIESLLNHCMIFLITAEFIKWVRLKMTIME